jgi:hypothetical protein
MRWLLSISLVLLLVGCADRAPQSQILAASKAEISKRETWSEQAYVKVEKAPGGLNQYWKVSAGAMDTTDYPNYNGIKLHPGTGRKLCFTRSGCLVDYADGSSACIKGTQPPVIIPSK